MAYWKYCHSESNKVSDLKVNRDVVHGRSRERILISIVDRTEFFHYLSGRQVSIFNLLSFRLVLVLSRENWRRERPEENNLCFVPCSHKKLFLLGSISPAHKYFKSDEIIYQENENKRQFYEAENTISRILGKSTEAVKIKLWLERAPGGVLRSDAWSSKDLWTEWKILIALQMALRWEIGG